MSSSVDLVVLIFMAHQDYVSRGRPKKKKSKKTNKKQLNVKTKLFGLLTVLVIAAFVYFLWIIKHKQPIVVVPKPVATQTKPAKHTKPVQQSTKKTSKGSTKKLPELADEKWSYPKELAEKKVKQSQYEVTDKGPWKMQCASFKSDAQAQTLKAKIAFLGIESQVVRSQGENGTWYKVVLGPYQRKRTAEKDKHKLRKNGVLTCQIWLWR
jgi:cell division septation protein DedD